MKFIFKNFVVLFFLLIMLSQSNAQEYYGYPGTNSSNYVDWSRISRDMNGAIQQSYQDRENRKAELDKISYECMSAVSNRFVSSTVSSVVYLCQLFQNATISELQQYNQLLKSGNLDPSDFSSVNRNCVYKYYNAVNYCTSLDYDLKSLDRFSDKYNSAQNDLNKLVRNSSVSFYTNFNSSGRYRRVLSQDFSISAYINGRNSQLSFESFFYHLKNIFEK